jgi:KaiC/GvpD/RAD55 family RecA-like ATPase
MADVAADVGTALAETGPSVATVLQFPVSQYFEVLRGLVDFTRSKGMGMVYITAAVPAGTILSTFEALDVETANISFVDSISQMMMSDRDESGKVIYVESPTVLENIILKVAYLMRRAGDKKQLVLVDSINSLALHNDAKMLSEFLHVLISSLSPKEAYPVVLATKESMRPEIAEMLALVCDQVVELNGLE